MAQTDRLSRLKAYLDLGRCVTRQSLLAEFEISPATLKRDIALLRDSLNAPIVWDRERSGYRLDRDRAGIGPQYELPGLWLNAAEIHALLTMQHLLANLDAGGLLCSHIEPLMKRLSGLLGTGAHTGAEVVRRIRVQTVGARKVDVPHFQAVGSALLRRRDGLDFARAVGQLGVDRGISSFRRFGFFERNGKAFFAAPLNVFPVRRNLDADLIVDIERRQWLVAVQRHAGDAKAPQTFRSAAWQLDAALFAMAQRPSFWARTPVATFRPLFRSDLLRPH